MEAIRRVEAKRPITDAHQSLRIVIPLLFERQEPEDKLPEMVGWDGKYELELDQWNNWIDVQDDVPFHTVMISMSSGPGYFNGYLVRWAERDGRFRTTPLRPGDDLCAAAEAALRKLHRERDREEKNNDPEAKKWLAYHIRRQVYAALAHLSPQQGANDPFSDESWESFKKQGRDKRIRWDERQQNYVFTIETSTGIP